MMLWAWAGALVLGGFGDRQGVPRSLPDSRVLRVVQTSRDCGRCDSAASWRACYPAAQHVCASDAALRRFVLGTRWASVWPRLRPVERADVYRYLAIHRWGGIYSDCDNFCVRPLPLPGPSAGHALLVGRELRPGVPFGDDFVPGQLVQWVFGSANPHHPALQAVLDAIYAQAQSGGAAPPTLAFTGPFAFTRAVRPCPGVLVLPQEAFACNGYGSRDPGCRSPAVLTHHRFDGSWRGP